MSTALAVSTFLAMGKYVERLIDSATLFGLIQGKLYTCSSQDANCKSEPYKIMMKKLPRVRMRMEKRTEIGLVTGSNKTAPIFIRRDMNLFAVISIFLILSSSESYVLAQNLCPKSPWPTCRKLCSRA